MATIKEELNIQTKAPTFDYFGCGLQPALEGIPDGSLYYYLLDKTKIQESAMLDPYNTIIIPPTDQIVSVNIHPYLDNRDLVTQKYIYDKYRFPITALDDKESYAKNVTGFVWRITGQKVESRDKGLGTFKPHQIEPRTNERSWRNEGKLYLSPFSYGIINDGLSSPFIVHPQYCDKEVMDLYCKAPVNAQGLYSLYVKGYKKDDIGNLEGVINSSPMMLPSSSNGYMNYMSQNQNRLAQSQTQATTQLLMAGAMVVGGAIMGGVAGAVAGGGGLINGLNSVGQVEATKSDLINAPNSLVNTGGDALFGIYNNKTDSNGDTYCNYTHYMINEYNRNKLENLFCLYGYKQNKLMYTSMQDRKYFNYAKFVKFNCESNGVPIEHLNRIKVMYENGVTRWHMKRGYINKIYDYSMDNVEV